MATKKELIQRWDAFLQKIEMRYIESLQQAEEACLEQLIETDYDYYTVFRSWQGMKAQIDNILLKIDETWEDKVRPQMEAISDNDYFYEDEGFKAEKLSDKLHEIMERFQTVLEGKLSQQFYNHAITIANQDFNCSQCSSPLTIKKDLFRAQYVTCTACNSVNTFEPETKFVQIGWNIIDNIVALQCLPLHDKMDESLEKIKELRKEHHTDEVWNTYKDTYFTYWETFFKERIKLKSDAQERYKEDMERKRKEYQEYENIQRYNKYGIN
jgi:hypothetical protein